MEVLPTTPPPTPTKLISLNPPKKKKKKSRPKCPCIIKGEKCGAALSLAVGYCKWCNTDFCSSCRIPEVHNCPNLADLKASKKQENSNQLNMNKCHISQIEHQSKS